MAEKMKEEGEIANVDDIAKSVLRDFTKAKFSCFFPSCNADPNAVTKRCGRCRNAYYCSLEHQKEHWKTHKKECFEANIK